MSEKIIQIKPTKKGRIIVISDIHGHIDILKNLLQKVAITPEDRLIILGDIINKGPNNLDTAEYIMSLADQENIYIMKGNHELFITHFLFNEPNSQKFLSFLQERHFRTIIHEICELEAFDLDHCSSMSILTDFLLEKYNTIFSFLKKLPIIANFDNLTFVHGGYDQSFNVETDENRFLKYDNYNDLSPTHTHPVIVGHWPTSVLRQHINTNTPYHNTEKNITFVDGGLGVKSSGELNALIITIEKGHPKMTYFQENAFEKVNIIKTHQFNTEDKFFINYPHFDIEILDKGDSLSKVKHVHSQRILTVFSELIHEDEHTATVKTPFINHFLNLEVGTTVELVKSYDTCSLVKYKDEFGWVYTWQLG